MLNTKSKAVLNCLNYSKLYLPPFFHFAAFLHSIDSGWFLFACLGSLCTYVCMCTAYLQASCVNPKSTNYTKFLSGQRTLRTFVCWISSALILINRNSSKNHWLPDFNNISLHCFPVMLEGSFLKQEKSSGNRVTLTET